MSERDIEVIEKVYNNVNKHKWDEILSDEEYYSKIDFPADAKRSGNVYYSEVKSGLVILTGTYQTRFYYEEDNFTWQKEYFCSIILNRNNNPTSIAFITDEDYENMLAKKDLFNISRRMDIKFGVERKNIIRELYDCVNRKASGVDDLYNDFLNDL